MKKLIRKQYSEEFKKEIVQRILDGPADPHQVGQTLRIGRPTLDKWVRQFKEGRFSSFSKEALLTMRKLKAENKRLKAERDILKKSSGFFGLSQRVRFEFIFIHKKLWSIGLMCKALKVSRSGYYDWLPHRYELKEAVIDPKQLF